MELPPEVCIARVRPELRFGPRYVLIEQLGEGGLGTVWKAWDLNLEKFVAIKRIRGAFDAAEVEAFLTEGRVIARLEHPNITPVYDVGVHDGIPYIVMQLVEGPTLALVRPEDALPALRDAARAVAFAHRQGVLHQDLKPENLMLGADGRVQVLDFGITRTLGGSLRRAERIGTPGFMSPEQESGGPVDARSDVYGLGATLRALIPNPSPLIARFVGQCQEPDPNRRFRSMDEAAAALERMITAGRRRWLPAAGAVAVVALLLIGAAPKVRTWVEERRAQEAIEESRGFEARGRLEEAYAALARAGDAGRARRTTLALALGGHEPVWEVRGHDAGVTGVAFCANGRRVATAGRDSRLRFRDAETGALLAETRAHDGIVTALDADPAGAVVATGGEDRHVKLWDGDTGSPIREWDAHAAPITRIRFAPDGRHLASGAVDGCVRLWSVGGGPPQELKGLTGGVRSLAFTSDGSRLAAGGEEDRIFVWDLRTGESRIYPGHITWSRCLSFSPDGSFLLAGFAGNILHRIDLPTGRVSPEWKGHGNFLADAVVLPGGSVALTASGDATVKYWDCSTGRAIATLSSHPHEVLCMSVRDGSIVTGCFDGTVRRSERRWSFAELGRLPASDRIRDLVVDGALEFRGGEARLLRGDGRTEPLYRVAAPDADLRPLRPGSLSHGLLIFRQDGSGAEPIHVLELATRGSDGWTIAPVDRDDVGWGPQSIVTRNGDAHILYRQRAERLRHAQRSGGAWTIRDLGNPPPRCQPFVPVERPDGRVEVVFLEAGGRSLGALETAPGSGERISAAEGGQPREMRAWRSSDGRLHAVTWNEELDGLDVLSQTSSGWTVRRFGPPGERVACAMGWSAPDGSIEIRWALRSSGVLRSGRLPATGSPR